MAYRYYQNYIDHVAETPNEAYRNSFQALIDQQWDNTVTLYPNETNNPVQKEIELGTFEFENIEAHINHVIAEVSTGRKNGDDFRKLIFRSLTYSVSRGLYFNFDNNYWLTTFTDEYNSVVKSIIVRRCNNTMKYINPNTGELITIPCVLDYDSSSPSPQVTSDIITPNNHIVLIVQGNSKTIGLKVNQRFLFNQRPYKLTGYNNYLQNDYVNKDTPLLYYDLYLDEISPNDDLVNNIANRYEYNYSVDIIQQSFAQVQGFEGILNANAYFNSELVNLDIVWESDNANVVIDQNGHYILNGEVGSSSNIKCYLKDNPDIYDSLEIAIVETPPTPILYTIAMEPLVREVKQKETQEFSLYLYENEEKKSVDIEAIIDGVDNHYYKLSKLSSNTYSLSCLKPLSTPIVLKAIYGNIEKEFSIKLTSMF